jgi:hypothetical protein
MSTDILDQPIQVQDDHREAPDTHRDEARGLTTHPGEWFELETTQHDWFGLKPNHSPDGATLHVKISGGFEQTVRQAQAGAMCGRRYQWLLHDAGLWDIHVEVQFDTPAGDARRSECTRPRIRARGRPAPR